MDQNFINNLHSGGLDGGHGDSRNPDEIKNNKGGQHTNRIVSGLKYKDKGYAYSRCSLLKLLDSFVDCQSKDDVDVIVELMINDHLLINELD